MANRTDWLRAPDRASVYRTVPHITLKSIAQNTNLDPIFAKHEPILDEKLAALQRGAGNR